jgi:uncharacterized delta-60 repeat protein
LQARFPQTLTFGEFQNLKLSFGGKYMKFLQNNVLKTMQIKKIIFLFFFILVSLPSLFAQSSQNVDLSFNAAVSRDSTGDISSVAPNIAFQPDGKILVFGYPGFNNISGIPKNKIARLNADGTLDVSFDCVCENFSWISSAVVQADGKIVIGGGFGDNAQVRFARLNPDGSVDTSFVSPFPQTNQGSSFVWAVQADGKIYVSVHFAGPFLSVTRLHRLNPDGSFDNSFAPLTFDYRGSRDALNQLILLPDGKIMIGGKHQFGYVFRVNPDGTKDTSFESPALTATNNTFPVVTPVVYDFGLQSNGKVVITGNFITVNGINRTGLARLNADGSVDLQFSDTIQSGGRLEILSNDKILLKTASLIRLNSDGTLDNTFNAAYQVEDWQVDSQERIVFVTSVTENGSTSKMIGRMNADGSLDTSFNFVYVGLAGEVTALAVQPDGKVLIGGFYNRVNGVFRPALARVNADGSLDTTFNAGSNVAEGLNTIVVQSDGKILIGGDFQVYNNPARQGIARLNPDGSLDEAFNPVVNGSVKAIALLAGGRILIGGNFTSVNGTSRTGLARLNSDGSLDTSFNPLLGSPTVFSLLVQSDGKILVGGSFSGVNGFNRSNLTRLGSDGSLDTTFNAGSIQTVTQIAQNSDGKYMVLSGGTVLRRNADGTADNSFQAPTIGAASGTSGFIKRFFLQPDGNIVLVGQFISINGVLRNNIARIRADGLLDTLFFTRGTDRAINTIVGQKDGRLIIGGSFTTLENIARSGIARITLPAFRRITYFDYDGDGRADISVFRPSENRWYVLQSSNSQVVQRVFGISGDIPAPADFDGDGKTDFAVFRPSSGDWWYLSSTNSQQVFAHWGASGDIPRPSDFDGDGRADYIVFRPSDSFWYRYGSSSPVSITNFGLAGDKPVVADFDGDGKTDRAIYRPSSGEWWWQSSVDNVQRATRWGISTDIPAPADFDGDGKTDFAVYRRSEGAWYIFNSSNGSSTIIRFGVEEDKPVAADYDGDGRADIAVFRPSEGVWYLLRSTEGFTAIQFGVSTDIPTPNAFIP